MSDEEQASDAQLKGHAEALKAAADARAAEAGALKAERENLQADSPAGKALSEAEARKAIAEADQQAAAAQQKQLSALVPDLSKAGTESIAAKGEQALFGTALAQQATAAAATRLAEIVAGALAPPENVRLLVTSDALLASSDAIYVEVEAGLEQLDVAATKLLEDATAPVPMGGPALAGTTALAGAAALAGALPGVISLLSSHRALATSEANVDSLAAAALVAGRLAQREPALAAIIHDDFRLLPTDGPLQKRISRIAELRQRLVAKKITLEDQKAKDEFSLSELAEKVKDLSTKLDAASKEEREAFRLALEETRRSHAACERRLAEVSVRIGLTDSTIAAIDRFTVSLQTKAEGASHSPLAAAILRERLHLAADDQSGFTHALLIRADPGSAQQLIDDRPLLFKDRFSTIATGSVTYMLIETVGSKVLRAGSQGGEAKVSGTIGKEFKITAGALVGGG